MLCCVAAHISTKVARANIGCWSIHFFSLLCRGVRGGDDKANKKTFIKAGLVGTQLKYATDYFYKGDTFYVSVHCMEFVFFSYFLLLFFCFLAGNIDGGVREGVDIF